MWAAEKCPVGAYGKLKKILAFLQWLCYTTEMTVNI